MNDEIMLALEARDRECLRRELDAIEARLVQDLRVVVERHVQPFGDRLPRTGEYVAVHALLDVASGLMKSALTDDRLGAEARPRMQVLVDYLQRIVQTAGIH